MLGRANGSISSHSTAYRLHASAEIVARRLTKNEAANSIKI